jgi:transposase
VQRWLHDYLRFGLRGLEVGKSPGAPRRIDPDGEACLQAALSVNPHDLGYHFTRWTLSTLAEHLYHEVHTRASIITISRALHRLRYRYKRPKLSLKHRQKPREVRRARAARDAALKKLSAVPGIMRSSSRMNASSISIPA